MDEKLVMNIQAVISALETIEIKGRKNMEALLGSIQHLEKIANGELGEFVLKSEEVK